MGACTTYASSIKRAPWTLIHEVFSIFCKIIYSIFGYFWKGRQICGGKWCAACAPFAAWQKRRSSCTCSQFNIAVVFASSHTLLQPLQKYLFWCKRMIYSWGWKCFLGFDFPDFYLYLAFRRGNILEEGHVFLSFSSAPFPLNHHSCLNPPSLPVSGFFFSPPYTEEGGGWNQ